MRTYVILSPALASADFLGFTLAKWWEHLLHPTGLQGTVLAPEEPVAALPALLVDGRAVGLSGDALLALAEEGGVLGEPALAAWVEDHDLIGAAAILAGQSGGVGGAPLVARDLWELALAERALTAQRLEALGRAGVRFADPARVVLDAEAEIAPGAWIGANVELRGNTRVASGARVEAGAVLSRTTVHEGAVIHPYSVCEGATVGPRATVGPMAHLREAAILENGAKVGNFVEVKKSTLGEGAKASHLTYIGDASIGARANIGAGTITCNYDGFNKHRTVIGAGAFIGSNTALVAPIEIGAGAIVGAGSTLSRSVPEDALAVERAEQRILEGKAKVIREKNQRKPN